MLPQSLNSRIFAIFLNLKTTYWQRRKLTASLNNDQIKAVAHYVKSLK
jgi:hypothetical protein